MIEQKYECSKCGGTVTKITRDIQANEGIIPNAAVEISCSGCPLCRMGARHQCDHTPKSPAA